MTPRDIFALAVRLVGLFFLYLGLKTACAIWTLPLSVVFGSLLAIICYLAVAWWLIGGAPPIVRHAYPEKRE